MRGGWKAASVKRHFLIVAVAGFLLLGAIVAFAQQEEQGTAVPAAPKSVVFDHRLQAAQTSLERERQRVSAAQSRYAEEQATTPILPREYLVSFRDPIAASPGFAAMYDTEGFVPTFVWGWASLTDSAFPSTLRESAEDLGWPTATPKEMADTLRTVMLDYLRAKLDAVIASSTSGNLGSVEEQEVRNLISQITLDGVPLFGFRCICSPDQLAALKTLVPDLHYRSVELADAELEPIWPEDRLRDLVIETGGTFGRD